MGCLLPKYLIKRNVGPNRSQPVAQLDSMHFFEVVSRGRVAITHICLYFFIF